MSWQLGPHPDDAPRAPREPESPFRPRSVSSQVVIRPRSDTREAVVLELLPLAAPALAYGATQVFVPWGIPLVLAAIVATVLAGLVVASRDHGTLGGRGFVDLPSPALALLGPVLYLTLRGRACRGHDRDAYAPLPWAIGATVVAVVLLLVLAWFEGSIEQAMGDGGGMGDLAGLLGG